MFRHRLCTEFLRHVSNLIDLLHIHDVIDDHIFDRIGIALMVDSSDGIHDADDEPRT